MLIEYKIKFEKDGVTITQRIEPGTSKNVVVDTNCQPGGAITRSLGSSCADGAGGGGAEDIDPGGGGAEDIGPGGGGAEDIGPGGGGAEDIGPGGGGADDIGPGGGGAEDIGPGGGAVKGSGPVIIFGPIVIKTDGNC